MHLELPNTVYDRHFFEDLDLQLAQDHPPYSFAIDFPGVHSEVVDGKSQRLDKKKDIITKVSRQPRKASSETESDDDVRL